MQSLEVAHTSPFHSNPLLLSIFDLLLLDLSRIASRKSGEEKWLCCFKGMKDVCPRTVDLVGDFLTNQCHDQNYYLSIYYITRKWELSVKERVLV